MRKTDSRMPKLFVVILVAAVAAGLGSCTSEKKEAAPVPEVVRNLAVLDVQRATVPDVIEAPGTVHASQSAQIAAQIMGNVIAINVREGDHVKRGQMLAVLDDAQPRAAVDHASAAVNAANHEAAAAEADYTLASATLKRYQDLFEKKSVSPQEFDEVKARYQAASARQEMARAGQSQAKAALLQANTTLGYTRIRAPFDGVVSEKKVDPGALAAPGMPLLTVEGAGRFRLEATVDETSLRFITRNSSVPVRIDALGEGELAGKVVQIVPAADPASRTFVVKVELPANAALRSGMFGRAYFSRGKRESILVPRTVVVDRGQLQGVYTLGRDKVASLRYVTLGKPQGEQVEVLSGLEPGDRVVAAPDQRDLSGKRVEVQ
ncbi:MAG: efflux RND transporter periplasmic adaptor subunit [Terriglobales bacterium]